MPGLNAIAEPVTVPPDTVEPFSLPVLVAVPMPDGRVSARVTFWAPRVPVLVTVITQVIVPPGVTDGVAVFVTTRLGAPVIVAETVAELLVAFVSAASAEVADTGTVPTPAACVGFRVRVKAKFAVPPAVTGEVTAPPRVTPV